MRPEPGLKTGGVEPFVRCLGNALFPGQRRSVCADDASSRPRLRLFATDLDVGGGTEMVLRHQVSALRAWWDLEVISSTMPESLGVDVAWRRIPVPRRPAWLKWIAYWVLAGGVGFVRSRLDPKAVTWATGCIVPLKVDAITMHFCHAGYVQAIGGMSTGRHGWRRVNAAVSRRVALAMEWWCLRPNRVRALLAVSPGVAAEVEAHYPGLAITVTPNGVALPECNFRGATSNGPLRAVFIGGDWGRKGLALVIRAIAEYPNAVLVVVGDGPESEGPSIADAEGVGDRITFAGYHDDVGPFLDSSDVLVLPSAYETFALVVFEAAAHGVVPIVTPVHGVASIVEHDASGFILSERSAVAVCEAFRRLDSDRASLTRMSVKARQRARDFTWERSTGAVNDALGQLV